MKRKRGQSAGRATEEQQHVTKEFAAAENRGDRGQENRTDLQSSEDARNNPKLARQAVMTTLTGLRLTIDRPFGLYRLSFDKKILDRVGMDFFEQQIKPLLTQRHALKAPGGGDGPEIRFYWQPDDKDWTVRFLFIERDANGREVERDGKRQYIRLHHQVQTIATDTVNAIDQLLSQKLGMKKNDVTGRN